MSSNAPEGSPPNTVWSEDGPTNPSARTAPPRHAEAMAERVLDRLASRASLTPKRRFAIGTFLLGAALIALAALFAFTGWDATFLRIPRFGCFVGGCILMLKATMGYR